MSRAVACPCLKCCWGLQISQGLAGRTGSLATIGKALVHIFNWEGDCKTEDNTDPLNTNDPKPGCKKLFSYTACQGSQLIAQLGHVNRPHWFSKGRLHVSHFHTHRLQL